MTWCRLGLHTTVRMVFKKFVARPLNKEQRYEGHQCMLNNTSQNIYQEKTLSDLKNWNDSFSTMLARVESFYSQIISCSRHARKSVIGICKRAEYVATWIVFLCFFSPLYYIFSPHNTLKKQSAVDFSMSIIKRLSVLSFCHFSVWGFFG